MIKTKCKRLLSALLAAALLTGTLGGCGKSDQESDSLGQSNGSQPGQESGDSAGQEGGGLPQSGRGRYVEKQETLPQELQERSIVQMYTAGDKLRFLAMGEENGKTVLSEWEKQGDSFTEVTQGWLSSMDLPAADWLEVGIAQGEGGSQYLYTGYTPEGEKFAYV